MRKPHTARWIAICAVALIVGGQTSAADDKETPAWRLDSEQLKAKLESLPRLTYFLPASP
jgi:hypothetical protein